MIGRFKAAQISTAGAGSKLPEAEKDTAFPIPCKLLPFCHLALRSAAALHLAVL